MDPPAKRQKTAPKPQQLKPEFALEVASWSALRLPFGILTPTFGFYVALFMSGEDGDSREYRAVFGNEESAKRFWAFVGAIESVSSGAAPQLMLMIIEDHKEVMRFVSLKEPLDTEEPFWLKEFVHLVRASKLECPKWTMISPKEQSWHNLDQAWDVTCPGDAIRAVFRLASSF